MTRLSPKYHIFLSYRREDGKHLARMLKESLASKGYRVFLDLDELQDGIFDERILEAIDEAPIYMLLMTEQCFQRCGDPNDWVRQELERAIAQGKTIIPINPDKQFTTYPSDLPEQIQQALASHQYSAIDTGQLYQESINKLIRERIKPMVGFKHNALIWAIILFFITLVPYGIANYLVLPHFYIKHADKILMREDASHADTLKAIKYYQYAIKAKNKAAYGKIGDLYDATSFMHANWLHDEDSALYYYKQGAYAGNHYCQCKLAEKLSSDWSLDYSLDSAFYWAEMAYKGRYYKAPATLALFYRNGRYVAEDKLQAERLYKEGIAWGDSAAHLGLGSLYQSKFGLSHAGEAIEHYIKAHLAGEWMAKYMLGITSKWVLAPPVDSVTEPLVKIKSIGWDKRDTLRIYCEWHNKKYLWMQIDTSAYIEDAYSGQRYTISRVHNCKFSPDTTHVTLGHRHAFQLLFVGVPDTLTRIHLCESDTSRWKFYGIDLRDKLEIGPLIVIRDSVAKK